MRSVPFLNLQNQHAAMKPQLLEAIGRVLDQSDFILGKDVAEFEKRLAKYCGTRYAIGVNSGTDAIFLVLKAYGIGPGDEVITAPNSFLATASAIAATGATPVFVDIQEDMNIDPDVIEAKISPRTKVILPVHLTGRPAAMTPILALAKQHRLRVVEDAAQAIGAEYAGKRVGALGDAGCFSLHPLKTLNACGDGGAITTSDPQLYETLVQLRNIGLRNRNESSMWGFNSRLDSLQAAIVNVKFDYLDQWTEERRQNAAFYTEHLHHLVQVPREGSLERCVYHTYVIQTDRRDGLQAFLEGHGVETKVHYPIPIHLQVAARDLQYRLGDFPVCERVVSRMLSLPIYQGLTADDMAYVVEKIRAFLE